MESTIVRMNETSKPRMQSSFDDRQDRSIRVLADALHRLNNAIVGAVDAGLTIELMRASRYHAEGGGKWGDQMVPIILPET